MDKTSLNEYGNIVIASIVLSIIIGIITGAAFFSRISESINKTQEDNPAYYSDAAFEDYMENSTLQEEEGGEQ